MADDRGPVRQPRPAWATLEVIIARLAATGRLKQFSVVQSEDRFQASVQRSDRKSYGCSVKPTALEAVLDCLGPMAFQSWEDFLGIDGPDAAAPEDEDDGMRLI